MLQTAKKSDFSGKFFWHLFYFRIRFLRLFNRTIYLYCQIRGIKLGQDIKFTGFPRIRRHPYSETYIGNKCTLNSYKHSDFFGLQKPCTLVTLNKDAEIKIGNNAGLTGTIMVCASRISIGNNVMMGEHTLIFDTDFHNPDPSVRLYNDNRPSRPVTIEDNVFIGYNCLILKGVTIGKNSVIGANSVVIGNVPENSIAIGNPCKVIMRKNWNE